MRVLIRGAGDLASGIALRLQEDAVVRLRAGDQLQRHGVGHGGGRARVAARRHE